MSRAARSAFDSPLGSGRGSDVVERGAEGAALARSPLRAAAVAVAAGGGTVLLVLLVVGELVTRAGLFAGLRAWDDQISRWMSSHRTPAGASATKWLTNVANTQGIVLGAVIVEAVLAVRRRWRDLLLVVLGLAVEVAIFLTVNELVRRSRPTVPKLGTEPATYSFPSGHVAATVVLYGSIALLVVLTYRSWWVKVAWVIPTLSGLAVGFARVYRGMHHLTDVLAGALLGALALLIAVVATRATAIADEPVDEPVGEAEDVGAPRVAAPGQTHQSEAVEKETVGS